MSDDFVPPPPPGAGGTPPPPPPPSSGAGTPPPPPATQPPTPGYAAAPPPSYQSAPPPGYVAYSAGPQPVGNLSRVSGLQKALTVLIAIAAIAGLFTAAIAGSLSSSASDFLNGDLTANQFIDDTQALSALTTLLGLPALAAGIVTMIWMYRVASNVRAFQRSTTFHPLFAVFGWILPPVLYIIPLLMMRELWKASDPDPALNAQPEGWRSSPDNPMLWLWFALYSIVPLIVTIFAARSLFSQLSLGGTDADSLAAAFDQNVTTTWISAVLALGAAYAWIMLTRALTERHVLLTSER